MRALFIVALVASANALAWNQSIYDSLRLDIVNSLDRSTLRTEIKKDGKTIRASWDRDINARAENIATTIANAPDASFRLERFWKIAQAVMARPTATFETAIDLAFSACSSEALSEALIVKLNNINYDLRARKTITRTAFSDALSEARSEFVAENAENNSSPLPEGSHDPATKSVVELLEDSGPAPGPSPLESFQQDAALK